MLPLKPINMLFGPSGAGKSLIALDMGLSIARGINWREFKTKHGPVCWLAAEAEGSMRNRSIAYEKYHHGFNVDDAPFYVLGYGIDLTSRETLTAIAEAAKAHVPVLIVVDTLAAAAGAANENSGEDMNPVLDNCKVLHEITGGSVLLIHHSGKDEAKGSRGWSGIKARVDAEIEVTKQDKTGVLRHITTTKQRDGEEGVPMPFKVHVLNIGMDADGDMMKSAAVEHVDPRTALQKNNDTRRGQGKWHKAIREALLDAPDMRLETDALLLAATAKVPEKERTTNPRKQLIATLNQMFDLGEVRVARDGLYEFTAEAVSASPDALDPDADLLGD